jgi:hypothetical protein
MNNKKFFTYIEKNYLNNINLKIIDHINLSSLTDDIINFLWVNAYITNEDADIYFVNSNKEIRIKNLKINDYIKEKIELYFTT